MNYRLISIFLCFFNLANAQNISGLWVHDLEGTQPDSVDGIYAIMYLDLEDSGEIKGYTYDYQIGDWCSYYLEGAYDSEKKRLKAVNTKKIRKSFLHARSKFTLFYDVNNGNEVFVGRARQKGVHGFLLSFGGALNIPLNFRKIKPKDYEDIEGYTKLKPYIDSLEIGFETTKNIVAKSDENLIKKTDETDEIKAFAKNIESRTNELLKSHTIKSRKITLEILDNSRQDGDRISIYLNGKLIIYNTEVKREPKSINIELPESIKTHTLLFVANNLGRFSPNTATIKYNLDGISHEIKLFTDKKTSKYLEFTVD